MTSTALTKISEDQILDFGFLDDIRKINFLKAYAQCGVIQPACNAAGIGRSTYYYWRRIDDDFRDCLKSAFEAALDVAEVELRDRGVHGIEEPVIYRGRPVWKYDPDTGEILRTPDGQPIPFTVNKRSDRLLEVYVKAHRPIYREKGADININTDDDGKAGITVSYVLPDGKNIEDYD